ncbi:MAG: DNA cytosine methyltransferase [Chitinophagales bacterium]
MKAVSLFTSGGIGDLALRQIGVEVIVANELIYERAEVFKYNYPKCQTLVGDIYELKADIIVSTKEKLQGETLDFLLATPPCQGMSKNGRGKLLSAIRGGKRPKLDIRNQLIVPTIDIIVALLPNIVVFENVPEMKDTIIKVEGRLINIIDFIKNRLEPLGYIGSEEVVEFANFGVPQRRKRLITIFSKSEPLVNYWKKHFSFIPKYSHSKEEKAGTKKWVSVKDVIAQVPKIDAKNKKTATSTIPFHRVPILKGDKYFWVTHTPSESGAFDNQCIKCGFNKNAIHGSSKDKNGINKSNKNTPLRCQKCNELLPRPWVKEGDNYRLMKGYTSAYRRMKWNLPATALTTNLSYACSDNKLHPEQNRVLSLYEAFIIHTISQYSYIWQRQDNKKVSDKLIREIIGESIPPKGLEIILNHLKEILLHSNLRRKAKKEQLMFFQEPQKSYSLSLEL